MSQYLNTYVKKIPYTSPTIAQLQTSTNNIERQLKQINTLIEDLESNKKEIAAKQECIDFAKSIPNHLLRNTPSAVKSYCEEICNENIEQLEVAIRHYNNLNAECDAGIESARSMVAHHRNIIADLVAKSANDEQGEIIVSDVRKALKDNPMIEADGITITKDGSVFELRIPFVGLFMRPTRENGWPFYPVKDGVPLPKIMARFHFNSQGEYIELRCEPINHEGLHFYSSDTKSATPHILSDHSPCLGGFSTAIPEYINKRNWPVLVTILVQYLQQAIEEDSAGSTWINCIPSPLRRMRVETLTAETLTAENQEWDDDDKRGYFMPVKGFTASHGNSIPFHYDASESKLHLWYPAITPEGAATPYGEWAMQQITFEGITSLGRDTQEKVTNQIWGPKCEG